MYKQKSTHSSSLQQVIIRQKEEIRKLQEEISILRSNEEKLQGLQQTVEIFRNKINLMNQSNERIQVSQHNKSLL